MTGNKYEPDAQTWPFYAKDLLSPSEKSFHAILQEALPEFVIYVQVPLSQMLRVERGHNQHSWNNRINRMSVDFVVSDESTRIIAAIELDDPSHDNPKRQADDAKKDKALTSAGIRVLRWRVERMPDAATVRASVLKEARQSEVDASHISGEPPVMVMMRKRSQPLYERYGMVIFGLAVFGGVLWLASLPREQRSPVEESISQVQAQTKEREQSDVQLPIAAPSPGTSMNYASVTQSISKRGELQGANHESVDSLTAVQEECRSWRNSNVLEPTPEKRQKIAELCPGSE
jgi:very-short-patch-repair endonuclease